MPEETTRPTNEQVATIAAVLKCKAKIEEVRDHLALCWGEYSALERLLVEEATISLDEAKDRLDEVAESLRQRLAPKGA
jgi:hypothetical protein